MSRTQVAGPYTPPQWYFDLVAQGEEPHIVGMTMEWRCRVCDKVTFLPRAGGLVDKGACDPRCASKDLEVYGIFAGQRDFWCTADAFPGPPDPPARPRRQAA